MKTIMNPSKNKVCIKQLSQISYGIKSLNKISRMMRTTRRRLLSLVCIFNAVHFLTLGGIENDEASSLYVASTTFIENIVIIYPKRLSCRHNLLQ